VVGSLTIGIPAFFIALGPNTTRARAGFVDRVLRFAIPAGTIAGVATFAAYLVARHNDIGLNGERSVAVVTLFCVATWVLTIPIRPLRPNHIVLLAATVVSFIALTTVGFAQRYLEFESPPRTTWAEMATIIAGSIVSLEVWNRLRP
jgi:cation-transporting ATPase E